MLRLPLRGTRGGGIEMGLAKQLADQLTNCKVFSTVKQEDDEAAWCHPKPCHGDVLIKLLKEFGYETDSMR